MTSIGIFFDHLDGSTGDVTFRGIRRVEVGRERCIFRRDAEKPVHEYTSSGQANVIVVAGGKDL